MILFPAIDLRDGQCVRLYQGDYGRQTVYGDDPVAQAKRFVSEGAEILHVVDLDAALSGEAANREVIGRICAAVSCPVQVGGGVRNRAAAEALYELGVDRVVIGTAAVENPELVEQLVADDRSVAVGIDARGTQVASHGWTESGGQTTFEVAAKFADMGVEALIATEIGRDGTMEGPDIDGLAALLAHLGDRAKHTSLIASGGVGRLEDLGRLSSVAVNGYGLGGVIVGRALYEQAFTLSQALTATLVSDSNDEHDSGVAQ